MENSNPLPQEAIEKGVQLLMSEGKYPEELARIIAGVYDEHFDEVTDMMRKLLPEAETLQGMAICVKLNSMDKEEHPWVDCYSNSLMELMEWLNNARVMLTTVREIPKVAEYLKISNVNMMEIDLPYSIDED